MSNGPVGEIIFKPITHRKTDLTNGASGGIQIGKLGAKKRQAKSYGVICAKSEGERSCGYRDRCMGNREHKR